MATPSPPRPPLGPSEEDVGPVPLYAPGPEAPPPADASDAAGSPPPDPFALSWAALRAEIAAQADYASAYAGIAPRDRPYVAVPAAQLRRLETLIVELRRRVGAPSTVLPGVPDGFVTPLELAQLLAPHLRRLAASDPARRADRSAP